MSAGAVQLTNADALRAEAVTLVGTAGAIGAGITEFDAVEAAELPIVLSAVTVNVYAVPFVSPPIVAVVPVPVTVVAGCDVVPMYGVTV